MAIQWNLSWILPPKRLHTSYFLRVKMFLMIQLYCSLIFSSKVGNNNQIENIFVEEEIECAQYKGIISATGSGFFFMNI